MTSASTKKWRRNGHEVVEAGRGGRRILMAVQLYPNDHASLDLAASAPDMEREIQRLRTAMAHAMDDCMWIAILPDARADVKRRATKAHDTLKTALEKK